MNDKFQDSLYLFLELVRAGVMHGHLWSGRAFSGGPSFGTGTAYSFPRIVFKRLLMGAVDVVWCGVAVHASPGFYLSAHR